MTSLDDKIALIAIREYGGVSARAFQYLISKFGSMQGIVDSKPDSISEIPGMSAEKENKIKSSFDNAELIKKKISDYSSDHVEIVTLFDQNYPESLLELSDPPPLLYYKGNLDILRNNCVAILGTHEASAEGISEAVRISENIAESGGVVVSGLARGIDSSAHIGAINGGGQTVAVLGCGFNEIFPEENFTLADNVSENGVLISEYPPEKEVSKGRLIARNKIIIGLSQATIVVEVTSGTGSTTTAIEATLDQGKSLYTCFDPNRDGERTNDMGAVFLKEDDDWKMVLRYMV